MKTTLYSLMLLLGSVVLLAQPGLYPRTIEVSSKASQKIKPMSADISLTVYSSSVDGSKNVAVAQTESTLREGLKKLGIKDEDFFSTTPVGTTEPTSRTYTIKLRNFDLWPKISGLFDYDLVENIFVLSSDVPDSQKAALEKELTKETLSAARKKADELASQIQAKIKRIYALKAYSPYIIPPAAGNAEGGVPGQINLGESTMEMEIYVTYEIE